MRILIVDDDAISRRILTQMLREYGIYDVAVNGNEAVEIFKLSCEQQELYDLVLLDINMPKINGHDVLKEIRKIENESGIDGLEGTKIIMTTASDDFKDLSTAFKEQCDAYIIKPVTKTNLKEAFKTARLVE